jgi:hypothetical protein
MLPSVTKRVVALLAVNATSPGGRGAASARTGRFGVFSVQNDTGNVTVHYQVKIGDGPWVGYTVLPGQSRTFWHEYRSPFDRSSPPTTIRFNSAIGDNPPFTIRYSVQRYAAPDRLYEYAKKYSFRKTDDNYFDLTSIN